MRTDKIECFLVEPHNTSKIVAYAEWGSECPGAHPEGVAVHYGRSVVAVGSKADIDIVFASNHEHLWKPVDFQCARCKVIGTTIPPKSISEEVNWWCPPTGEVKRRKEDFGPGAMWFATWERWSDKEGITHWGFDWTNQSGPPLYVMTPGGSWCIDQRASNCTLPNDTVHRCWVRHGEAPNITVDKQGRSCSAGAGSIRCGAYHGFLREGRLVL
jgi:hypothetical protein